MAILVGAALVGWLLLALAAPACVPRDRPSGPAAGAEQLAKGDQPSEPCTSKNPVGTLVDQR